MASRFLASLFCLPLLAQPPGNADRQARAQADADLRARIEASPELPFTGAHFAARPPTPGWESGFVSWLAVDAKGGIYEIQRGEQADPVLVLDRDGKVLRSWGKGNYQIPHSIRLDPAGNIWTVDAGSSVVIEYSPLGEKRMTIDVGEAPVRANGFAGTTDIAFGPRGRLFITDGYGNARVLEYTAEGKRVKQWGKAGIGPGEFRLPHAIQIAADGTIYVADRENGRIQMFDLDGAYRGEIAHLGRTYSLKLAGDVLWAGMQPMSEPTGAPGWLVKLDRHSGKILGHLNVSEDHGLHSVEQMPTGEPVTNLGNRLLWFHAK